MTEYLVIYETDGDGWSAWAPDVPGCYAAGRTREEVERLMGEAVPSHLDAMRAEGLTVPAPHHTAGRVAA